MTLAVLCYRFGEDKIILLRFCSLIAGTIHVTPFTVSFCCIIIYWGWIYSVHTEIKIATARCSKLRSINHGS